MKNPEMLGYKYTNEGFHATKKHQRNVNRLIKKINKQMIDDEVFQGCFTVKQIGKTTQKEDGYTYMMYKFLLSWRTHPEKNKIIYLDRLDTYMDYNNGKYSSKLWIELNNFIVDHCKYWEVEL